MAGPSSGHRADDRQESVGDLVALAASGIAQLIRCELDLAKMELKQDGLRIALAGAALVGALFTICLMLVLVLFAWAFGLAALGAPGGLWGAFLFAALTCLVIALAVAGILYFAFRGKFHGLSGLRKTRSTISGGIAMIRSGADEPGASRPGRIRARKAGDG